MAIEYNKKGLAVKVTYSWCMEDVVACTKIMGQKLLRHKLQM